MKDCTVVIAKRSDESRIANLITLAFATGPVARWVLPDPLQYLTQFLEFVRLYAGKAFDHNCAHTVDGSMDSALWLPPDVHPDDDALSAFFEQAVTDDRKADLFEMFERMGRYHPEEPHWFLPLIGVDPMHQGHGRGSALLKHGLAVCDRNEQLAYLDSSNQRTSRCMNGTASSCLPRSRWVRGRRSTRCFAGLNEAPRYTPEPREIEPKGEGR